MTTTMLVLHVAIALGGIIATLVTLFSPSQRKIAVSGIMVALTVISGTVLVVSLQTGLLRACLTGLTYVSLNMIGISLAKRRLNQQHI